MPGDGREGVHEGVDFPVDATAGSTGRVGQPLDTRNRLVYLSFAAPGIRLSATRSAVELPDPGH